MGKRGPLPNPKSARSKRRGVKPVVATGNLPRMPSHLKAGGRDLWRRVTKGLEARRSIGSLHYRSLVEACDLADQVDELKRDINANGIYYVGPNGAECLRPAVKQLNKALDTLLKYLKEFGATPAADERLHGSPEPEADDDPLDILSTLGANRN